MPSLSAYLPQHARRSPADPTVAERPMVLIAEDDVDFAELVADMLEEIGCAVDVATCGQRFKESVDSVLNGHTPPFDLIITDINMPRKNGLDVLEHLRARDWSIPVIVMSAFLGLETTDEAIRLGAEAVLSKPVDLAALQHHVSDLVPGVDVPAPSLFDTHTF